MNETVGVQVRQPSAQAAKDSLDPLLRRGGIGHNDLEKGASCKNNIELCIMAYLVFQQMLWMYNIGMVWQMH